MRKFKLLLLGGLLLAAQSVWAQKKIVTGKVTDPSGSPLYGISVVEKGTRNGTSTSPSGTFSLTVGPNASLVISAVGFETKQVPANEENLQVQLTLDTRAMSEVVVTGVGVATSKRKLGISVEAISGDKLPATPSASVDQALVGKIPGAQISSVSGNPGDPVNILLRGINSVQGGTRPLILLDGLEVRSTDINSLDLSNIDRIEVVQGAASATLYGAQGANGVIQLFSKKGKRGPLSINFSSSYSSNTFLNVGDVHKSMYHPYKVDANNNILDASTGQPIKFQPDGSLGLISYDYGGATRYGIVDPRNVNSKPYNANLKYYDHFKEIFQTGYSLNNSISLSGASEKSDFYLATSNNHTLTPILKNGYLDRTNLSSNVGMEIIKGLKLRSITELVYTKNTMRPRLGGAGGVFGGYGNQINTANLGENNGGVYGFLNTSPFFSLASTFADGTPSNYLRAMHLSVNNSNPYYTKYYAKGLDNKIDIVQNFDANYQVNKFVELDAKYGIDYRTENDRWTFLNQSQNIAIIAHPAYYIGPYAPDANGEIEDFRYTNTFQNFLATVNIKTDFEKDFNLKLPFKTNTQVAFDYRKNEYREYDTYGVGLSLQPPINIQATSGQAVLFDYEEPQITYGYLVDQKIDIGEVGGLTAGFRSDWSSNFGGGSKPFTFPHGSVYFLPSAFDFWKNGGLSTISFFKLRAAYGQAGIQPAAFQRIQTIDQGNIGSQLAYSIPVVSNNPDLDVEVSTEYEVGTDFSIAIGKGHNWLSAVNGSFTYWKRKSKNVIYQVSAPISTGSTGQLTNSIDMSSNGVQFQLNVPVLKSKNINWDFTLNAGHATSVVDKVNGEIAATTAAGGSTTLIIAPGEKIGQIYGLKALTSLDQTRLDGTRYIDKADEGLYTIVDGRVVKKSDKQIQFTNDSYAFGDPNPKFNASFINSVGYRDFITFSFQIDWVYGSHLYNQTKEWMYRDGIHGDFDKPVTIDGQTGAWTAYWVSPYYNTFGVPYGAANDATKDFFYEDASFARLRNVSLAFDFTRIVKIKYFKKLQLVLTGRNLYTITDYSGFDPELNSGPANSSFERGIDHSSLPNIKSYQVGVNIGF